jgi:hypothetical protein
VVDHAGMRPPKPLALLAVPAAALALSACGVDVSVGGDDVAQATITADGHTYEVTNLHIDGSSATAKTQGGRTLTFHKVGTGWTLTN